MSGATMVVRGYGFLGTLAIMLTGLFVAGQVFGFLSWSWWLVLLPAIIYAGITIGIPIALIAVVFSILALVIGVALVGLICYVLFLIGLTIYKSVRRKVRNFQHDRRNRTASKVS